MDPIKKRELNDLLQEFEKECDCRNSVSRGYHNISAYKLEWLERKIIELVDEKFCRKHNQFYSSACAVCPDCANENPVKRIYKCNVCGYEVYTINMLIAGIPCSKCVNGRYDFVKILEEKKEIK